MTKGYTYAGVQFGAECFCGNEQPGQQFLASVESECNMRCPGDNQAKCGGSYRMNVYNVLCLTTTTTTTTPAGVRVPVTTSTPG